MKRLLALAACLILAACTTTDVKLAPITSVAPPQGAKILIMQPDVQLSILTASGAVQPRADWSNTARDNLVGQFQATFDAKAHSYQVLAPETMQSGRIGQLMRLHEAVGASINMFEYTVRLPTHPRGAFNWTLGEGANTIAQSYGADYALFTTVRGTYSSDARMVMMVGMALLGVGLPSGQQQMYSSLVNLHTGQVVWFNVATAGPEADMRQAPGARTLVAKLLEKAPL